MARFYNFETAFRSLRDQLRDYLKAVGIYYELSGALAAWHFEIKATPEQADAVNRFLDSVTFTEQRA